MYAIYDAGSDKWVGKKSRRAVLVEDKTEARKYPYEGDAEKAIARLKLRAKDHFIVVKV